MHSSFFKSFQSRRLRVRQPRLGTTFGKRPAPAAASPDQKKFNLPSAHPVANGRNLLAPSQPAQMREPYKIARWPRYSTHVSRMHERHEIRLEARLVPGLMALLARESSCILAHGASQRHIFV